VGRKANESVGGSRASDRMNTGPEPATLRSRDTYLIGGPSTGHGRGANTAKLDAKRICVSVRTMPARPRLTTLCGHKNAAEAALLRSPNPSF
jgi:hypothetical protein